MKSNLEKIKNLNTKNKTSGITLIALVVTIVVLLILAGITINMLFSENGIITKAKEASEKTAKVEENEIAGMQNIADEINKIIEDGEKPTTLEDLMNNASEKEETVEDVYGNKIVVPAGFKIVAHGTDNVKYTYNEENGVSTNIPAVQDGIVIENEEDGNQFVWIPIGDIKNKDNTTTTIQLGRYSDFTIAEDGTLPTPAQAASKTGYDIPVSITFSAESYIEISNDFEGASVGETTYKSASEYENTKAYDLGEWISTTLDNGGYYISRFEVSDDGNGVAISKFGQTVWTEITQSDAAIAAKTTYTYSTNLEYYSDLINSYAWDTSIIFIEAYAESDYANSKNDNSITTTGSSGDQVCNINDMSGNAWEWTTETCYNGKYAQNAADCTSRGCFMYYGFIEYTAYRSGLVSSYISDIATFRTLLCLK